MRIVKADIKNFMSIGHITLDLDKTGLNLVLGKNLDERSFDSNGSAKSAVFESIAWCLYGQLLRELNQDQIIRNGESSTEVNVLIDPEDGTDKVWIRRRREKKGASVKIETEAGKDLFPSNSIKDVQPLLDSWLGADFKVFTNSVYFGKGLVKFFMAASDSDRRELLESILQLVSFDDAWEKAKLLSKNLDEEEIKLKTSIHINEATCTEKLATLRTFKENLTKVEQEIRENKPEFIRQLAHLKGEEKELSEVLIDIVNETKKLEEEKKQKLYILSKESLEGLQKIDKKCSEQSLLLSSLVKSINLKWADNKKLEEEKYLRKKESLKKVQENYSITLKVLNDENVVLNTELKLLLIKQKLINTLEVGVPCSQCGQLIDQTHKNIESNDLIKQIALKEAIISSHRQEIEIQTKGLFEEYNIPFQELESSYNEYLDYTKDQQEQELSTIYKQEKEVTNNYRTESLLFNNETYNKANIISKEFEGNTKEIFNRKEEVINKLNEIKVNKLLIDRKIEDLDKSHNSLTTQVKTISIELERLSQVNKQGHKKIEDNNKIKLLTDFWIEGFGPRGIKSFIFESALPYLTERTNYYSTFITGGTISIDILPTTMVKSTGNIKEKLHVVARNLYGANLYTGNSDGERRRIDVCILLALSDVIATRATKQWNTLIFDEIMDSLDKTGIEHVIDLFRTFENKNIFIISHSEDLKKYFDTSIVIQKLNGVSSLKG